MSTEITALEEFFAAINRNDIDAAVRDFDPQIVRIEPAGFPTSGTYRGVAEVQTHISQGRGSWAEGSCEPEKFLENGDKTVVFLHVRVRMNNTIEWIDARFADGFVFRNGKIVQYRTFAERSEALEWAGLKD